MTRQQQEEYIERVAAKHHISSEEVLLDIENCITETHRAITMSENSELLREWEAISQTGGIPTACEFVGYAVQLVWRQLENE